MLSSQEVKEEEEKGNISYKERESKTDREERLSSSRAYIDVGVLFLFVLCCC